MKRSSRLGVRTSARVWMRLHLLDPETSQGIYDQR
jgi:hypothetical protein